MRPKKSVLLYCADAVAGEQMAWLLEIRSRRLRVTAVSSPEGFAREAAEAAFDCVVVHRSELGEMPMVAGRDCADQQVFELLRRAKSGGVSVELMDGLRLVGYSCANRVVPGKVSVAMAEVVNAVAMACTRKRGPHSEKDVRRGFSLAVAADRMVA